jgi:hypothetical protein
LATLGLIALGSFKNQIASRSQKPKEEAYMSFGFGSFEAFGRFKS